MNVVLVMMSWGDLTHLYLEWISCKKLDPQTETEKNDTGWWKYESLIPKRWWNFENKEFIHSIDPFNKYLLNSYNMEESMLAADII